MLWYFLENGICIGLFCYIFINIKMYKFYIDLRMNKIMLVLIILEINSFLIIFNDVVNLYNESYNVIVNFIILKDIKD